MVSYLVHVITSQGVSVDTSKIEAVVDWPKPTSVKAHEDTTQFTTAFQMDLVEFEDKFNSDDASDDITMHQPSKHLRRGPTC